MAALLEKVNQFEAILEKPFHCNSGIRSIARHNEIYAELQSQDMIAGKPPRPVPMFSCHLVGRAVDISVPGMDIKDLQNWFKQPEQIALAEALDVWFEDFQYTNSWLHLQDRAPKSKKRFFIPF